MRSSIQQGQSPSCSLRLPKSRMWLDGRFCIKRSPNFPIQILLTLFLREALSIFSRRRSVGTKIFFTAIAKPNPQHLGNLVFLLFGQGVVELESASALPTTSRIIMSIPIAPRYSNTTANFFYQCLSGKRNLFLSHFSRPNFRPRRSLLFLFHSASLLMQVGFLK